MTNSKYKLLLLDYGGVYSFEYVFDDYETSIIQLFGKHIPAGASTEFSRINDDFGSGLITSDEFITRVADLLDAEKWPTQQELEAELLRTTFTPSTPMVGLVNTRKALGIKAGILSDICTFQITYVRSLGGYDGFDKVLLSAEAGMTKNNPDFYKYALKEFDVTPGEVLFVDDRIQYVQTAQSLGFDTLLADKKTYKTADELSIAITHILDTK